MLMRKKLIPSWTILCVEFAHSPHPYIFSLGSLVSSHISKMCLLGELMCLYCPSLSVCVWGGGERVLCDGMLSCPGLVLTLHPEFWDRLRPPETLNWNQQVGKS